MSDWDYDFGRMYEAVPPTRLRLHNFTTPRDGDHTISPVRVFARDMLDSLTGVNAPPRIATGLLFRCSVLVRGNANCIVPGLDGALLPDLERAVAGGEDPRLPVLGGFSSDSRRPV